MSDIVWTNDTRTLADLVPWEHNPKVMSKKQADGLRVSIEKFGFAVPFLVGPDNAIYDGHQRDTLMQAMRQQYPKRAGVVQQVEHQGPPENGGSIPTRPLTEQAPVLQDTNRNGE